MGAPQRFLGDSVRYNGKKVEIALCLAVLVTRDREGYAHLHRMQRRGQHEGRGPYPRCLALVPGELEGVWVAEDGGAAASV